MLGLQRFLRILLLVALVFTTPDVHGGQPSQRSYRTAVYRGTWQSDTTGHKGPMRLRLKQDSNGSYLARFIGRFAAVIPFTYKTEMKAISSASGQTTLVANKRLPIFGSFTTTAQVTACGVDAAYCADRDRGRFTMTRVK